MCLTQFGIIDVWWFIYRRSGGAAASFQTVVYAPKEDPMQDELFKIHVWASHGTMKQFSAEVIAKLSKIGYNADLNGDTLTCYKIESQGGFLGIGARKTKKTVLKIIRKGSDVDIPESEADPEFVAQLSELLKQH